VSAVASLHQMDARAGLTQLRDLVAPGGVLVVIGLARPDSPKDIPVEVAAQVVRLIRPERGKPTARPSRLISGRRLNAMPRCGAWPLSYFPASAGTAI
jgi:hypothetical protein